MITALANYIADFIYANVEMSKEQRSIYVYGYEIIISSVLSFVLLIITGLIFGKILEITAFFIVFYMLRQQTGGYHADTYFKCNFIFEVNIVSVMLLALIDFSYEAYVGINIGAFVLCLATVFILAPMENENKPITPNLRLKHKIVALILTAIFETTSILLFSHIKFSFCISMAMTSTALAMLINIKKGEKEYEKGNNCKNCGKGR